MNPIGEAFRRIIQEVYWIEDLREAEEYLMGKLGLIDDDVRDLLLDEGGFCGDPLNLVYLVQAGSLSGEALPGPISKAILARSLVIAGFLMQCAPSWPRLSLADKARILVRLYKASYGLELALKRGPDRIDEHHLDYSIEMLDEAYRIAGNLGLLEELRRYIEGVARRIASRG